MRPLSSTLAIMNALHQVPAETANLYRGVCIVDMPGQFDHRGMILRVACDLENEFKSCLLAFLRTQNKNLASGRASKELFSENGLVGSLSKMTRLGYHLGLISADVQHDLRVVVDLRNDYAHGGARDQFYRDPEAAGRVRSLRLYINSPQVFDGFDEQGVFLACCHHLKDLLRAKTESLGAAENAG